MRYKNTICAVFMITTVALLSCKKTPGSKAIEAETVNNKISHHEPSNPNIYAELLDSIETKYQSVLILKDQPSIADSTVEKLKKLGFINARESFFIRQAKNEFKIINYYATKYPEMTFIYDDETLIFDPIERITLDFSTGFNNSETPTDGSGKGDILGSILIKYSMKIFDPPRFTGTIPNNISQELLNFRYEAISKNDLREIDCPLNVFDAFQEAGTDNTDRTTLGGKIIFDNPQGIKKKLRKEHDENPYHDFDIKFRIMAPSSEDTKTGSGIVLFPVKHGYLIVAQWGFEQDQDKLIKKTDSTSYRTITLPKFDYILNQVPQDGEVSYDFNGTLYWVDQYIAHYIDSLKRDIAKTKSQGETDQ